MVTDLDTGAVLAARDPHGRYQPASVLKLLAGLVLLPNLPGTRVITATAEAANAEGSAVGLVAGGRYTVDTLFKSLYLMSGNDAAMALALANGGPARTVAEMNAYARRLGAYDTVVQTPSGLDGWTQLTSAYDLTLILRAAVNTPRLLGYDEARTARLPAQKVGKRKWGGVPLFNESDNFFATVPGALLAKTGYHRCGAAHLRLRRRSRRASHRRGLPAQPTTPARSVSAGGGVAELGVRPAADDGSGRAPGRSGDHVLGAERHRDALGRRPNFARLTPTPAPTRPARASPRALRRQASATPRDGRPARSG